MRTSISQQELIKELQSYTNDHLLRAEKMQAEDFSLFSRRPDEYSWSANDCAQHLNMYFDFYLPEIKKRLKNAASKSPGKNFRAGLLGDYFAKSMLPQEELNTIKLKLGDTLRVVIYHNERHLRQAEKALRG